jgi:hypothetical protein
VNARALADCLDLDLNATEICLACLSFVSMELDKGNERKARGQAVRIAPDLWEEGLEGPLRAALDRAQVEGQADADEAIREVELVGPRARIVEAAILRLGRELSRRAQAAAARNEPVWPVLGFTAWREARDGR